MITPHSLLYIVSACWLNGEVTCHPLLYQVERHVLHSLDGEMRSFTERPDEFDDEERAEEERIAAEAQILQDRVDW